LKDKAAGEVMFSAGEIASVVLHRDLDLARRRRVSGSSSSEGLGLRSDPESFSGWPVLKDLEGRMGDEEVKERIGSRFLVARAVRGLLEDELVADEESLRYQVRSTRDALASSEECHSECADWDRVLGALDAFDFQDLTSSLLEWGKKVEQQGHLHGALEILGLAFELARFTGSPHQAADAARFKGKVFRTRAEWDQAVAWYGVARTIAEEIGSPDKLAAVLDGLANAYRDLGNLPRAREILLEVLEIGRKNGARYASAIGHHDLMTVEKLRGNLADAVQHGWQAVHDYDSREGSLRALFDLSGVLRESGELAAARDGYLVVAQQVAGFEYRILALDALAFIAALQGDHAEHLRVRDRMEVEGWQELSPVYQGQVLYYRGLSARALGCPEEAREWLEKALSYAETHSLNKLIFDVEEALVGDVPSPERPAAPPKAPEPVGKEIGEVRQGLRELRETLVKVGSDLLL
jgi:tetratricopeptide (TPR) repeat protein